MNVDEQTKKSGLKWWGYILIVAGCLIIWGFGILFTICVANCKFQGESNLLGNAGLLGDSSGAVNALFSALAFCGVIIAIILQKQELELQRKELESTNKQLEAQKDEFKVQNNTLKRQRFENTFFQMMSLQQQIISDLSYSYEKPNQTINQHKRNDDRPFDLVPIDVINNKTESISTYTATLKGRDLFSAFYETIKKTISEKWIEGYCEHPYTKYFDHYFRHLYRIIKFVDESDLISPKEKYEYIGMVRATLSKDELVWLFYNCLSVNGKGKFKPLIEKYAILKNLRNDLLVNKDHSSLYDIGAYKYTAPK